MGLNKMIDRELRPHARVHAYVLDDNNHLQPPVTEHEHKNRAFHHFLTYQTTWHIHSVRFGPNATTQDHDTYWTREFAARRAGEILIIFYHGRAGGLGDGYRFNFEGSPQGGVNASKLIDMACGCAADVTFLLDCWMQTRLARRYQSNDNFVEIIARPPPAHAADNTILDGEHGFTDALIRNLTDFAKGDHLQLRNRIQPISIPEILAKDHSMHSNPVRPCWPAGRTRNMKVEPRSPNSSKAMVHGSNKTVRKFYAKVLADLRAEYEARLRAQAARFRLQARQQARQAQQNTGQAGEHGEQGEDGGNVAPLNDEGVDVEMEVVGGDEQQNHGLFVGEDEEV